MNSDFRMRMNKTNLRYFPFICIADYQELRDSNKLAGRGLSPYLVHVINRNVYHNIDARSCNQCCSGKEMNITQTVCVIIALGVQLVKRMRHIAICSLQRYKIFFHIIL